MKKININKKFLIFGSIGAVVLIIILFFIFGGSKELPYEFVVAEKGKVVQEISVTGRVKPAGDVDLAFERSGTISRIYANIGDRVKVGQALISLNSSELSAQLAQAEAGVESAKAQLEQYTAALETEQARLTEFEKGTRPEEIEIQKVKVANAEEALIDAKQNLVDKIKDAYTKSDDAIRFKVDQFISNPRSSNPQLDFLIANSELESKIEFNRFVLEGTLNTWQTSIVSLNTSVGLQPYVVTAKDKLDEVKSFLEDVSFAVNSLVAGGSLTQTTIDGWKTAISGARTNVNTAIANLSAADEEVSGAESNLQLEEQTLALKEAGSTPEEILAQKAKVRQAEANVSSQNAKIKEAEANAQNVRAKLFKTIIRTPIDGIVTKQEIEVGEIVAANTSVISVISDNNFKIEADIPEVDVAKIEVGDIADITLDAYGDDVIFLAEIVAIDPAETIIEGVPSYTTTLEFKEEDSRIRSGMTANIDVVTEKLENVIVIPQRAVIRKDGKKIVRVVIDDRKQKTEEVEVETGLRGSYGEVEILRGISEGDNVVTYIK